MPKWLTFDWGTLWVFISHTQKSPGHIVGGGDAVDTPFYLFKPTIEIEPVAGLGWVVFPDGAPAGLAVEYVADEAVGNWCLGNIFEQNRVSAVGRGRILVLG